MGVKIGFTSPALVWMRIIDYASLDDWYCKFCSAARVNEEICICNAYPDPTRSTIKCTGQCEMEYHLECLGLDDDVLASSASWKCGLC